MDSILLDGRVDTVNFVWNNDGTITIKVPYFTQSVGKSFLYSFRPPPVLLLIILIHFHLRDRPELQRAGRRKQYEFIVAEQ